MPDDQMLVKNCFGWEHFHVYLSGPIDFDRKGGANWREEWTEKLQDIGLNKSQILNPCKKPLPPGTPFNLNDESKIMHAHRDKHEWKELCETVSQIAHVDLRLVDKSDVVLVNMPMVGDCKYKPAVELIDDGIKKFERLKEKYPDDAWEIMKGVHHTAHVAQSLLDDLQNMRVPTYGTIHEIVVARQQRKPVYVVWEGGKESCSGWLMWLVGHHNVFDNVDELITRLDNIAKGRTSYNAKDWLLLDLAQGNEV
jgi:hypothetical protein